MAMDSNEWKWNSVATELSAPTPTATEQGLVRFDFGVLFADLQRYKLENDHFSIPESHPLFTSILDGLSSLGMEELLRRRWDDQYASLRAYQGKYGDCLVSEAHPHLGAWVRVQCDHFGRYRQRLPSPLTKERFIKLKNLNFGEMARQVNREGAHRGMDLRQPRGRPAGVSVSFVRPKSSSPRPGARAGRNPPGRPTDRAQRHAVQASSLAHGRRRRGSDPPRPRAGAHRHTGRRGSAPPISISSAPDRASMRKNSHVRESQRKPPTRQMQSFDDPKGALGIGKGAPGDLSRALKLNLEIRSKNTRRTGRGSRPLAGNVHEKRRLRRSEFEPSPRVRGKPIADVIKEELGRDDGDSSPERHLSKDDIHVDVHEKQRLRQLEFRPSRRGRRKSIADPMKEERGRNDGDSTPERHLSKDDIHVDYTSWTALDRARDGEHWQVT